MDTGHKRTREMFNQNIVSKPSDDAVEVKHIVCSNKKNNVKLVCGKPFFSDELPKIPAIARTLYFVHCTFALSNTTY